MSKVLKSFIVTVVVIGAFGLLVWLLFVHSGIVISIIVFLLTWALVHDAMQKTREELSPDERIPPTPPPKPPAE